MENFESFLRFVGLQIGFRDLQEERPRLAQHSLLHVEVRQPLKRGQFVGGELGNLLVDGDGLAVEAVAQIDLREPLEVFDGLRHVSLTGEEIAHGHQSGLVFRIVAENLLIFGDGLGNLALVEILQRVFERFAFVKGHG